MHVCTGLAIVQPIGQLRAVHEWTSWTELRIVHIYLYRDRREELTADISYVCWIAFGELASPISSVCRNSIKRCGSTNHKPPTIADCIYEYIRVQIHHTEWREMLIGLCCFCCFCCCCSRRIAHIFKKKKRKKKRYYALFCCYCVVIKNSCHLLPCLPVWFRLLFYNKWMNLVSFMSGRYNFMQKTNGNTSSCECISADHS